MGPSRLVMLPRDGVVLKHNLRTLRGPFRPVNAPFTASLKPESQAKAGRGLAGRWCGASRIDDGPVIEFFPILGVP